MRSNIASGPAGGVGVGDHQGKEAAAEKEIEDVHGNTPVESVMASRLPGVRARCGKPRRGIRKP
jgi:hypothetical protein